MRPKERIKPFMKWLTDEWLKAPDQRFGQLLVNKGLIYDDMQTYQMEMSDYPLPFEVIRQVIVWGTYKGDKYIRKIGLVPMYKQIPICDLEIDHIKKILKTQKHIRGSPIEKLLKEELKWRKKKHLKH